MARVIMEEVNVNKEGDPKAHLKAFWEQMLIFGGSDVIRCKMFIGTLLGMVLKWFSKIPSALVNSFVIFL